MGRKRRDEATSPEDERVLLREQRHELERLKLQLADRIGSVEEREQELRAALRDVRAGKAPEDFALSLGTDRDAVLFARNAELDRRERQLTEREADLERAAATRAAGPSAVDDQALAALRRELEDREATLTRREAELAERPGGGIIPEAPPDPDGDRLAQIEARLAELREAEKMFGRTQRELAARSEALAARERIVAQRERELAEQEDHGWGALGGGDLESRLSRLERQQTSATAVTQQHSFAGGLRRLQDQGTRQSGNGS